MKAPRVSILMPVYNAEAYLTETIQSILSQTFKDFEFIIINDGSTDSSLSIIKKFAKNDARIQYTSRPNKGYAATLNEAVESAIGEYFARIDADDVSLPTRLEKQVNYLDSHPECSVVATRIQNIDENNNQLDDWPADKETVSPDQIRECMPLENCIAHPSIMARAEVLKIFEYDVRQVPSEDYDLWLRLLSAGHQIHKLDKKLLRYRIHQASVTRSSGRVLSWQKKYLKVKSRFLIKQILIGKLGGIEFKVFQTFLSLLLNMMWQKSLYELGNLYSLIRKTITRLLASSNRLLLLIKLGNSRQYPEGKRVLFIVRWMTLGGAEKVSLDLIAGLSKQGYQIFCISTVASQNEWYSLYARYCNEIVNIGATAMDSNKAWFISRYAESRKIDTVITSNNLAGYKAAKLIKQSQPHIKIIDILHGQGGNLEGGGWPSLSLPYEEYIDNRVTVTEYLRDYMRDSLSINSKKIVVIHNGITLPGSLPKPAKEIEHNKDKFIVLWAGRFSYEKHPELVIEVARLVCVKNKFIHFIIAGHGEMRILLQEKIKKYNLSKHVTVTYRAYDNAYMYMAYADILLMTSEMEGLPVVLLEAFSVGLPAIAPDVGGISEIINDKSGFLVKYSDDIDKKISEIIIPLVNNKDQLNELSKEALNRVRTEFSLDKMIDKYIHVIEST